MAFDLILRAARIAGREDNVVDIAELARPLFGLKQSRRTFTNPPSASIRRGDAAHGPTHASTPATSSPRRRRTGGDPCKSPHMHDPTP
jgi:hypothetical protein